MNTAPIFTRYDLPIEAARRQVVRRISEDALLQRAADWQAMEGTPEDCQL